MFVKVALHELLGHGSGKLLRKNTDGTFNFDYGKVMNPITGKPVETYYNENDTFDALFGKCKNSYEECRADSVALYLSLYDEILEILLPHKKGHFKEQVERIWISMIYYGVRGLIFYDDKND